MKKSVLVLVIVFLAGWGFCEGAKEAGGPKTFKITIPVASGPQSITTQGLISFKEMVEKESNGRINVQVHHSGSLYNSAGAFDAIRRGEVEMTFVSAAVLSDLMPKLAMFSSGYFYKDYKHMRAVLGGDIGTQLSAEIASTTGIRPIASFYLGSRHLNLRNIGRIVRTPDDLKGVKLRMPDAAPWLFLGRALGANPTPIAFGELYMALSTGTVDGQDNPLPLTESGKFFEVTHSISLTGHIVDSTFLVVNESFWKQLPDDLKRIVAGAAQTVERNVDKTTLDAESRLVDFFRSKGLVIVEPDKSAFRSRVQSAYLNDAQATKSWDLELFKRIQSLGE